MSKEFFIRKTSGKGQGFKMLQEYWNAQPDGKYKWTIEQSNKRSIVQNAWFHAILPQIKDALREAGYNDVKTLEDAKDVVKAIFFKKEITNGVETIQVIHGTSQTTKLNFAERADEIINWGKEYLGIDIAPPSKQFEVFE